MKNFKILMMIFIFNFLLLTSHFSFLYASDWPSFRGNLQNTGYTDEVVTPPLNLGWQIKLPNNSTIASSPVVSSGILYIASEDGFIYALNSFTGEILWKFKTESAIRGTPYAGEDSVWTTSGDGYIYSFDKIFGRLLFKSQTGGQDASSPILSDGKVYIGSGYPKNEVMCFDGLLGNLLGSYKTGQPIYSSPAIYSDSVYIGSDDGKFYGLSKDLVPQKEFKPDKGLIYFSSPAVDNDIIYGLSGDYDKNFYAWDLNTGMEKWRYPTGTNPAKYVMISSPAVANNLVYFAMGFPTAYLYALNKDALTLAFKQDIGSSLERGILSSPAISDKVLYIGSGSSKLYAIDALSGATLHTENLLGPTVSSPAISEGIVYITTIDGNIYSFEGNNPLGLKVNSPNNLITTSSNITVSGEVNIGVNLKVKGEDVDTTTGSFSKDLVLSQGKNRIEISATDGTNTVTYYRTVLYDESYKSEDVSGDKESTITSLDGTEVYIPEGVISGTYNLIILKPGQTFSDPPNPELKGTSILREIILKDENGAVLKGKLGGRIKITIPYSDTDIAGIKEENLRVFYYNDEKGEWEIAGTGQVVDLQNYKISVWVDHLSVFRIFEILVSDKLMFEAVNYPNPFSPNRVVGETANDYGTYFAFRLSKDANITIEIFTITGEKIKTINASGSIGFNKVLWGGINDRGELVANGVYIYRITAQAFSGEKHVIKGKMAVLR